MFLSFTCDLWMSVLSPSKSFLERNMMTQSIFSRFTEKQMLLLNGEIYVNYILLISAKKIFGIRIIFTILEIWVCCCTTKNVFVKKNEIVRSFTKLVPIEFYFFNNRHSSFPWCLLKRLKIYLAWRPSTCVFRTVAVERHKCCRMCLDLIITNLVNISPIAIFLVNTSQRFFQVSRIAHVNIPPHLN